MELLEKYRNDFFENDFIEKVKKEPNDYIRGILKRSKYILDNKIIFTDSMDMESTFTPYKINDYKWKRTPNGDNEWCFMLSRHGFTLDLAITYILTNEKKYLFKWKELVFSFIKEEGIPNDNNKICWRPLDAGLRLSFWVRSLVYIGKNNFTVLEWEELLKSIEIHKEYLKSTFINKYLLSNWGVLALSGLILAILFEKNGIARYKDIWEKIMITIDLQFSENGVQWEQSPLYHHEVILNYTLILQVSETLDVSLPVNLREILKKFVNASYYMCDKKDYLLALNDSDYVDFSYVYDFYRGMNLLNDKEEEYLEKLQSKVLLGNYYLKNMTLYKKEEYSINFIDTMSGLSVIKDKDYYLTCFNGLHGSSHGQSSQGSITFTYKGVPILIDCGRFSYTECEKRIVLNRAFSHNTATLNKLEGTVIKGSWEFERLIEPLGIYSKSEENLSYTEMIWLAKSEKEIAVFRRNVFLFKDIKTLIIVDDVKTTIKDSLEIYFHLRDIFELELSDNTLVTKELLFYSDGKIESFNHYHSLRYNQLNDHTAIKVKGDNFIVSVISLEKKISIEKIPVYQNNRAEEFVSCKGLKLTLGKDTKEVYVNNSEIVKNDKLLVGHDKHLFYGSVVVFDNNKRIRIK